MEKQCTKSGSVVCDAGEPGQGAGERGVLVGKIRKFNSLK